MCVNISVFVCANVKQETLDEKLNYCYFFLMWTKSADRIHNDTQYTLLNNISPEMIILFSWYTIGVPQCKAIREH